MNLIESVAWFLQNEGAEQLRIFEDTGLDFLFVDEKFDLNIDSLSRKASVTVTVFDSEQMDAEVVGENDVLSVVNELSKQSDNITYYYEQVSREAYGRYSFNFSNLDELTFQLINACHGLIIAKETFLRVAAGSRVDAHFDCSFIYSEEEEATYQHIKDYLNINILYVHGFRSSGNSGTSERLRRLLPHCKIVSPDLPTDAKEAVALLKRLVQTENIDVVVGTSMGGMLAQKLRGIPKVLVNPSFFVSETFRRNMGTVTYFSEREDGSKDFEITPDIVDSYVAIERGQFRSISQKEKNITVGAFGNKDDVVNCKDDYRSHYDNIIHFAGAHRLDEESLKHRIIPAIAKVYRFQYVK